MSDITDGCDLDFTENPTPDDEVELYPLFAEALDPGSDVTVDQLRDEWAR